MSTLRLLWLPDEERNAKTPNSFGNARAPVWWSSRAKLGDAGQEKPRVFRTNSAKARQMPCVLRRREQASRLRWQALLSCTAAKAFEASLLDLRGGQGADGDAAKVHEVEHTFKYAGLSGLG